MAGLALATSVGLASSGSVVLAQAATQPVAHASTHPATTPTSYRFNGTPTVGALFVPGAYPASLHTCTASVIRSTSRDVIMTAAHCVSGTGRGYVFVPGYRDGRAPYGVWHVVAAYGNPQWVHHPHHQDTQRDWAFLRVADKTDGGKVMHLQDVVGGNRLGATATAGAAIRVPAYRVGQNDRPINCRTRVYRHGRYPAFRCTGYVGGTSGAPWLVGRGRHRIVIGVIGGLHQGGCTSATSYSARLGKAAHTAFERADHHRRADAFPSPQGDGC